MLIQVIYRAFERETPKSVVVSLPDLPQDTSLLDKLEYIFRQLNHVDGTEWISNATEAKSLRSMSVGDEVRFPLGIFRVEGCGWSTYNTNTKNWESIK